MVIGRTLRRLKIGGDVASLIEHRVSRFDGYLLDELTNTEFLLSDYFNADHIPLRIEVEHDQTALCSIRFGADNLRIAKSDVGRRGLCIDLNNRRLGNRNDETFKPALPNIR